MNKKIFIILFLVGLSIIIPIKSYFVYAQTNKDSFIEIEKDTKNKNISIKIDLDSIEYNNFNFKLESNLSLLNMNIVDDLEQNLDNLEQSNYIFSFDYSKETSNLDSIILNYNIPDNIEVDDIITFKVTITSTNEEDEVLKFDYSISIDEDYEEEDKSNNVTKEKVMDKIVNDKSETISTKNKSNVSKNISTSKKTQVVYNGSDNNYLSSLSISNYSLNREFKKEVLTYFVSVEDEVNSLNVSAVSEDSNSKVYISGNDNLDDGINKILISVVAENGNTKNYRIYVIRG